MDDDATPPLRSSRRLGRLYLLAAVAVGALIAVWFVVANGRPAPGVDDNPLLQERPGGSAVHEAPVERP